MSEIQERAHSPVVPDTQSKSSGQSECHPEHPILHFRVCRLPMIARTIVSYVAKCRSTRIKKKIHFKVETLSRECSLYTKAKEINGKTVLRRIEDSEGHPIDMIAQDVCHHMPCLNKFMKLKQLSIPSSETNEPYTKAFTALTSGIHDKVFKESSAISMKTLCDR